MWYEVGLMDIKGKRDRMEGLGCLPGARRTLEVTTSSPDERGRDKNNNNDIDAVSQIEL